MRVLKSHILFFFLAFCFLFSASKDVEAQEIPQYIGTPNSAVHIEGRLYVDTLLVLPFTDTLHINSPVTEGAFIYQASDNELYYFTGEYWKQLTTKKAVDSTFQQKLIFTKQYINNYSNSTFSLAYPPAANTPVRVFIGAAYQDPSEYIVSGQTVNLNFSTQNDKITVEYYRLANP